MNNLVADGDSITAGFDAIPYTSVLSLQKTPWNINNVAVPGETLATMLVNAPSNVDSLYEPLAIKNVVVIWGGTNDFADDDSVSTVYSNLVSYCQGRRAIGFKVIVVTMLSRNGFDTQHDDYNNLIRENWIMFADGLADVAANPNIGSDGAYSNTTYFVDGIHPTTLSVNSIIAPTISQAINQITSGESDGVSIQLVQAVGNGNFTGTPFATSFTSPNTAGNLSVVAVGVNLGTTVISVSDTNGNTYVSAGTSFVLFAKTYQIFYAANIKAGANTVNVAFTNGPQFCDVCIHEFSGIATTSPQDGTQAAAGASNASSLDSGPITTTNSNDLIFGVGFSNAGLSAANIGSGFTAGALSRANSLLTEYKIVSSTGNYDAIFSSPGSGEWEALGVAFKAAVQINGLPIVSPADVTIIIIYNQNGDGTLSPALTPSAATPKVLPTTAIPVQVFNTQNADGTLTSSTVS